MRVGLTTAIATAIAIGVLVATGGGGATIVANFWVDPSGGTCVDNVSQIIYPNDGTECGTLNAAVQAAEPSDVIGIKGGAGAYPFEVIAYRAALQNLSPGCDPYGEWGAASTTNCVKIINDGDVIFRGLQNESSALWFQGATSAGSCSNISTCQARSYSFHVTNEDLIGNPPPGANDDAFCNCASVEFVLARSQSNDNSTTDPDHVVADSIDADTLLIFSSHNVLARNIDVGPMWFDTTANGSGSRFPGVPKIWTNGTAGSPSDVVIDGGFFHEMNRTLWCDTNNYCHPDGMFINSSNGITIRNSGFSQIAGEVLFFQNFGQPDNISDITVENSWFGCKVDSYGGEPDPAINATLRCGSGTSFSVSACGTGGCVDWLVRYNSFHSIDSASEANWTNGRFIGNVGRQPGSGDNICTSAGITWSYNAFWQTSGGANCGATNTNTGGTDPLALITNLSPGQENLHLAGAAGSTVADNLVAVGTGDYALTTDIDGQTRPIDANRDAGIDER